MEDKSENDSGDENLQVVNSETEVDDDCHKSTNENHKLLVECFENSVKRPTLTIRTQVLYRIGSYGTETACLNNCCPHLRGETRGKRAEIEPSDKSNKVCKVLDQHIYSLRNGSYSKELEALRTIKTFSPEYTDLTYEWLEKENLIGCLCSLLYREGSPDIQYDVICIIENLCSAYLAAEKNRFIIGSLIRSLNYMVGKTLKVALLILRREILHGGEWRDQVLGELVDWLEAVSKDESKSNIRANFGKDIFEILSAICISNPIPDITVIIRLLPILYSFIDHQEIGYIVLKTITKIFRGGAIYCRLVINSNIFNKMMLLVCQQDKRSRYSAEVFRMLESITAVSDALKGALLDSGVMVMVRSAFFSDDEILLSHALSFLKNFIGNDCRLLQVVVQSDFFPVILNSLQKGSDSRLRREAAITLTSFFMVGEKEQLMTMARLGAISALCGLLDFDEFILLALKAIQNFAELCNEEGSRLLSSEMKKLDGHKKLKSLQDVTGRLCQGLYVKMIGKW